MVWERLGRVLPKVFTGKSAATATRQVGRAVAADPAIMSREAIAAARKAANPFDYGRKVLALPEGQVTTKSARVYTRSMGQNGQRVYTDVSGNQITFNGLMYNRPGYNESALYRTTQDGGVYSLRFSTGNLRFYNRGEQEVTRWIRREVGGPCEGMQFTINPKGKVIKTRFDYFNPNIRPSSSGMETIYDVPRAWEHQAYGWLTRRGVTEAPPLWTSIGQYTR